MVAPLAGIRVVEVANWVAAPSAAALMADMGADVLKIEPPSGDSMRGRLARPQFDGEPDGVDYAFQLENRGKRSIAIALERPEGQDLVHQLVRGADVFISNLLPERQQRYRLTPKDVRAIEPRIVYTSLTAYGHRGPEANRTGFDHTAFFSRGGVMTLFSAPGGEPPRLRSGQGDHMTCLNLLSATLAALRLRDQTGQGQEVEISLLRTSAWFVGCDFATALVDRKPTPRSRRADAPNPLNQFWSTKDDRWIHLMMPDTRAFWGPFCQALGHPEWEQDPRFESYRVRGQNMDVLNPLIDAVFRSATLAEWRERLSAAQLHWEPLAELYELIDDPQVRSNETFAALDHPKVGRFETVNTPFTIVGADIRARGPAPEIGADTDQVLKELGLSSERVAWLRSEGIAGPRGPGQS